MSNIKEFLTSKDTVKHFAAVHNTSAEKLEQLFELGFDGIPAPSIQVKPFPDKDYNLHTISKDDSLHSFGEISFIFDKSNIFGKHTTIPKNDATHKIYAGDAYTIRFPDKHYSIQRKPYNNLINKIIELDHHEKSCFNDSILQYLNKTHKNRDDIKERMNRSFIMKLMFIEENGMLDDFKVSKNRKRITSFILGNKDIYKILKEFSSSYIKENSNVIIDAFQKVIDETKSLEDRELLKDVYTEDGKITIKKIIDFHRDDIKIIKGSNTSINTEKTSKKLNSLVKKAEKKSGKLLSEFIDKKLSAIFTNPKIKGSNSLYTLENVLSWMKRNNGAGAEQTLYTNYNAIGATNQIILRHEDDFEYHRDKIVSHQRRMDYNNERTELQFKIENALMSNHYVGECSKREDKQEEIVFAVGRMGRNPDLESVKGCLGYYNYDVTDNIDLLADVQKFATLNNNVVHEYYEAKPMKDFYFNPNLFGDEYSIKGVVVPNNINSKVLEKLESHGIKVVKYNHKNPESRMRALYKFRDSFIKPEQKNPTPKKVRKNGLKK